jgi:tetratricopeptide (TPR) repeat protein
MDAEWAASHGLLNTSLPRYIANLGAVALSLKHYELAESCSRMAVMFRPANTSAVKNLAIANLYLERYQAAETAFRKFIELAPGDPTGPANLGTVYYGLRDYDRAEEYLMKALDMNNGLPAIHAQLGKVLLENGCLAEAGTHLQRALTLNPGDVDANFTMAFLRLAQGNFTEGWHYYASRFKTGQARDIRQHDSPRWEGQDLQGRHLLILTEQGLGDSIFSFRCIHPLLDRGGRISLEASPPLVRLFSMQPGAFDVIERNTALPGADYHTTTMSLPGLLGDTPDLNQQASLVVSTALTRHWRDRLGTATGFRIGINWQGRPTFLRDRWRSFDLGHFGPIADREGINLVSLQTGETGTRQIAPFQRRHDLQVIDDNPEGEARDMADTAAIMMNMDLIITSCTSVANLAGALGLPTWVLVSNAPDWRWMAEGDRTPWFPSVRVFRQSEPGNWDELFIRVEEALDELRRTVR